MVLKSTKENNITTFLIDKIKSSLDNVLLFCDERKDDESLEILLNLKKNQIEIYETRSVRPDRLYTPSEGLDWVDQKFHNKNGSVPDYIVLRGGFLAINLDIHSDDNILSLREYVLYFIKIRYYQKLLYVEFIPIIVNPALVDVFLIVLLLTIFIFLPCSAIMEKYQKNLVLS